MNKEYDLADVFTVGLSIAIVVGVCVWDLTCIQWRNDAVKIGHAEYYLDAKHERQWRWKRNVTGTVIIVTTNYVSGPIYPEWQYPEWSLEFTNGFPGPCSVAKFSGGKIIQRLGINWPSVVVTNITNAPWIKLVPYEKP